MLFSLIHTETGSSSRFRHFAFEVHRLIQSLFGYFHHNPSLMELAKRNLLPPNYPSSRAKRGDLPVNGISKTKGRLPRPL